MDSERDGDELDYFYESLNANDFTTARDMYRAMLQRAERTEARADALAAEVDTLRAELDAAPIQFIDGRAYRLIPVDGVTAGIWGGGPPQE